MDFPMALTPTRDRFVLRFRSDLATGLYVPGGRADVELTHAGVRAAEQVLWDGFDPAERVRVMLARVRSLTRDPVHGRDVLASLRLAAEPTASAA